MQRALLAILALVIAGCSSADAKSADMYATLKSTVDSLTGVVKAMEADQKFRELTEGWDTFAYMPIGSDGYSVIKTDVGGVSVSLADVRPFANGSKVTFQFGNATSATLTGVTAKLDWGKIATGGGPDNDTQHSKKISFNGDFPAGSWMKDQFVLEGVPVSELGFVRLSQFEHAGMSLKRAQ